MGTYLSIEIPEAADEQNFQRVIANKDLMDNMYDHILNEINEDGAELQEIRVDHVLNFIKMKDQASFEQLAADPRIVNEGYRFVMITSKKTLDDDDEEEDPPIPSESGSMKTSKSSKSLRSGSVKWNGSMKMSASMPSFHVHKEESVRLFLQTTSEQYSSQALYLSKKEFRLFLPTIYFFSLLWKVFITADTSIGNALINIGEYNGAYERLKGMDGITFDEKLTKQHWTKEFDTIDTNKSNTISFRELCRYTVKKVIAPMDYLKGVENKFYHFDMDEVFGYSGGGLPSGELRDIPASEYAAKLYDPEELEKNPVELNAQIFKYDTDEVETRCTIVTSRLVLKNNSPQIEFTAIVNAEENVYDLTLYGRKSFRLTLPDGKIASQGNFTLYPAKELQLHANYRLRDAVSNESLANQAKAIISAENDLRKNSAECPFEDFEVDIEDGKNFAMPKIPNAVVTFYIVADNYKSSEKLTLIKFDEALQHGHRIIPLRPKFYHVDLGSINLWGKVKLNPTVDEADVILSETDNLPIILETKLIIAEGGYKGKLDKSTCITAIGTMKDGKPSIELDIKLKDGVDELNVALYGKRAFSSKHPDGRRVVQGTFTLVPQLSVQPRSKYIAKDSSKDITIARNGTVTVSAESDPRTKNGHLILSGGAREYPLCDGIFTFPVDELPDGVYTITISQILGYEECNKINVVKFRQNFVDSEDVMYLKPNLPFTELGRVKLKQCLGSIPASDRAKMHMKGASFPLSLTSEIKKEGSGEIDPRWVMLVKVNDNLTFTIEFNLKSDIDKREMSLYGMYSFVTVDGNGSILLKGSVFLLPDEVFPIRYILKDIRTKKRIMANTTAYFNAKNDLRTEKGEIILSDHGDEITAEGLPIPVKSGVIDVPYDDLPDGVFTLHIPAFQFYLPFEVTRLNFKDCHDLIDAEALLNIDTREERKHQVRTGVITDPSFLQEISRMGRCPNALAFAKESGGWRCSGGGHFVSDADVEKLLS